MNRISDNKLLDYYIKKHKIENMLDSDILKHAQLHFYQRDEYILAAESELEYYYLLVEGKIKISYPFENGKAMCLKFYKDFNSIGDIELLKGFPIRCNIDAVEDTYLIGIPTEILRNKYLNNISLLHHLINSLSEKLYATINNSSYNFVYPLINRLSSYLVEYINDKNYIVLNSSLKDLSQFLGTTYRHLNRTITELEEEKIIKWEDKKIVILDEDRLRKLSKNLYLETL